MQTSLVITVLADDRPGIVEKLAATIAAAGGSWQESSMSRLSGKFAGLLLVTLPSSRHDDLVAALRGLHSEALQITVEAATQTDDELTGSTIGIEIVANDRAGIVEEISRLLASAQINVISLETFCESAPMSAEPMFHAQAYLQLPESLSIERLTALLEQLSADLMVELLD
ncbi:glycine cleavage system protein R [Gammaproteobacteria bacterium LSUCC0057]|uniref:Glycine cleavage system transcriptional repressor n=1 Tax=Gammaproteobacteria bacterium LSUCC0057 TaxID=2559237 RepID=A0A4Y8UJ59_9GAMM|nr:glycine cleavage system protein R [Gammaproteobacteria bacterium LSUCC0057]